MVILVVEDEGLINLMVSEDLRRAGHMDISAYSADQAIAIFESRNDIRLVFTDVDMPGSMNGLRLAAAVRDRWPPVQIVITSGSIQTRPCRKACPSFRNRIASTSCSRR